MAASSLSFCILPSLVPGPDRLIMPALSAGMLVDDMRVWQEPEPLAQ